MDNWGGGGGPGIGSGGRNDGERPKRPRAEGGGNRAENLEKLQIASAKQTLMSCQRIRMLLAVCIRTWIIPTDDPVLKAGMEERTAYSKRVESNKKNHNEGQPDHHVWRGIVMALRQQCGAGTEEAKTMEAYWATASQEVVKNGVRVCQTSKAFKSSERRFELHVTDPQHEGVVCVLKAYWAQKGYVEKQGQAPKGGLERDLEELLHKIDP